MAFQLLEYPRLSCFGHNLDLAINKSLQLDRVQRAIARCHSLVEAFSRSWKKYRDLHQKQADLGLKQHKLLADVVTRWGSTYKMIARILEQQQAICAVLAEDRKNWHRMPTDNEFSTLEAVASVLEPLSHFTDALSGEKCVTVSAVRPLLSHIMDNCLHASPDDCAIVKEMKEIIGDKLQASYLHVETSRLLDKCSYLDPRFRVDYLVDKDRTLREIESEAVSIAAKLDSSFDATVDEEDLPPSKKPKGLSAILKKTFKDRSQKASEVPLSDRQKVEEEMSRYQSLPPVNPEDDPLLWWKDEAHRLPILAGLARKYLSACGTSVASERLFSKAGYIVSDLRARLSPDSVNKLVFLARNMP